MRTEPGVFAGGNFYRHTPHFLRRRAETHTEATDERIRQVLENPEVAESGQGNRRIYWGQIREPGTDAWRLKVVVAENVGGPSILTAYNPERDDGGQDGKS